MLIGTLIVVISFVVVFTAYRMIDAKMKFQKNESRKSETETKSEPQKNESSQDWLGQEAEKRKNKTSTTSSRNYSDVEYVKGEIQEEPENKSAGQNRTAYY